MLLKDRINIKGKGRYYYNSKKKYLRVVLIIMCKIFIIRIVKGFWKI